MRLVTKLQLHYEVLRKLQGMLRTECSGRMLPAALGKCLLCQYFELGPILAMADHTYVRSCLQLTGGCPFTVRVS